MGEPNLQNHVTFWLCGNVTHEKKLYLHFCNTYVHQTWQSGNLPWQDPKFKVKLFFCYGVTWHMKKTFICTSTIPMATKLGKVVTYVRKTPPTKLCDLLIKWSPDKCKTLYLHFCNTYDHQTWLSGNLRWGTPPSKSCDLLIMRSCDTWKRLISALPQYLWPPNLAEW